MKPPPIRYADSPGGSVAYQVVGDGPIDLVWMVYPNLNLEVIWDQPLLERFHRRLAAFSRLILVNPRGFGVSDPIPLGAPPTLEEWSLDLLYVLDAVGSERAAIFGSLSPMVAGCLFAATYPERVQALALLDCYATLRRHDDYPAGFPPGELDQLAGFLMSTWGTGDILRAVAPELADDESFREWFGRAERLTVGPGMARVFRDVIPEWDIRGILPSIQSPTLVISHAEHPFINPGHGRYLAENIPNSRLVERPGFAGIWFAHDVDWVIDEVQSFLTGTRGAADVEDRVLATVLFTDIVGSTKRAADLGDHRWRELLDELDSVTRREVTRFRGRLVKSTGDGHLATFDGPARAIRCALAVTAAVRHLGIELRSGLHTGEVELREDDVGGIAVHIGERVMASAGPGEVLVSGAIPPLVTGSGIDFEDRGAQELKGVPGDWRLLAVKTSGVPTL